VKPETEGYFMGRVRLGESHEACSEPLVFMCFAQKTTSSLSER
jgi:hypothetical protein